jgi:hypothetical protein
MAMNTARPELKVAVVMRRERVSGPMSRWQTWRWVLADVVPHEDVFGTVARLLYKNDREERWLHPGFTVQLFKDDAEGYDLNLSTAAPGWFVLWRMDEEASVDAQPMARPVAVSLSYVDAGRWLDAQETVEQLAAPAQVVQWLQAFAAEHRATEPERRRRPESFRALADRFGQLAQVSGLKRQNSTHG